MLSLFHESIEDSDSRAFMLSLYQEFKGLMYQTVGKYISDPHDREDIVQDCLVKLIEKVGTLQGKDRLVLSVYIVFTVRNTAINYLNRKKTSNEHHSRLEEQHSELAADMPALDDLMDLAERKSLLFGIWGQLSEKERMLLTEKYFLDCSDQELAQMLCCKSSSIRMKLTRTRRKAYQLMKEMEKSEHDKTRKIVGKL